MKYYSIAVPIDKFKTFTYRAPEEMELTQGSVVEVPLQTRVLKGVVTGEEKPFRESKEIKDKIVDLPEELYHLALWISDYYLCPPGIVFSFLLPPFMKRINRLKEYSIIKEKPELTSSQKKVVQKILESSIEKFNPFLLHGVTGSGKTEVYFRVMEEILRKGRSVLYLTPEISMIPQITERIRNRFGMGEPCHSKLSRGKRYSYWMNALSGKLKIGIGSRMSIFSPLKNLGLIIVDEEHSSSYKQEDPKPRYSARDVAIMRGRIEEIPVILGSATPSVESFYNAKENKYTLLELPERVKGWKMPEVKIVNPKRDIFSDELISKVDETLKNKQMSRVILFLNRRGYAPYGKCYSCGWVAKCPNCDITLTYHKNNGKLKCHHCGYKMDALTHCPDCNSEISYVGWGTERIEERIQNDYNDYKIKRMDTDSLTGRHDHEEIYEGLKKGEIQILLGTQMVTKGLDFPDIGLVGVISADTSINFPDFRASEKTFQLLAQVAGRAGRGGKGKVIIQSNNPEHYAIQAASKHDFLKFYRKEIKFRKSANYPPFKRIARILMKSKDEKKLGKSSSRLKKKLQSYRKSYKFSILGPVSCPIGWIDKYYRYHILLKSDKEYQLQRVLKKLYSYSSPGVKISFEIDPTSML